MLSIGNFVIFKNTKEITIARVADMDGEVITIEDIAYKKQKEVDINHFNEIIGLGNSLTQACLTAGTHIELLLNGEILLIKTNSDHFKYRLIFLLKDGAKIIGFSKI